MKTLDEIAKNYFNTLNPIAERISTDILAVKEAYEDLWYSLSEKERNQIINETVVHPEALLKYTLGSDSLDGNLEIPIYNKITGSKYVVDENTGTIWRDEHSAPFSWKTPSQINLNIFTSDEGFDKSDKSFLSKNNTKDIEETNDGEQNDKNFALKLQTFNNWSSLKEQEKDKSDLEKNSLSPESNVVLVGTCSKLSGLCSKLKFLPSKSYSYEVQTVVANSTCPSDGNILNRLKTSAVHKFQSTLKLIGGKPMDKKLAETKEANTLIQKKKAVTIVKMTKASPKILKPKSPPPPPPIKNYLKDKENKEGTQSISLIPANIDNTEPQKDLNSEKANLLEKTLFPSCTNEEMELLSVNTEEKQDEIMPATIPSHTTIPKSGIDFLDNW